MSYRHIQIELRMHTANTHNVLQKQFAQGCLNVLERLGIMADTQATDFVTFDFKDTGVRCVVRGISDYQINIALSA